jgi:phosphoribosylformylglycinamidine synthase
MNPEYGKIDAYWMAASAIDEALRNAVCVGVDIERVAILDNFCWGNPYRPEVLGSLVRAAEACYDMAKIYGTPFISGKDSLHNEYEIGKKSYSIPPSLLISAVGIIQDIRKAVTSYFKEAGSLVYILGKTKNELGGSAYCKCKSLTGGFVPKVDAEISLKTMKALGSAIRTGVVLAAHDCSEGGLAVAAAEMAFTGHKGLEIDISKAMAEDNMSDAEILFSESNSRFIVEIAPGKAKQFEKIMADNIYCNIGKVAAGEVVTIKGRNGKTIVNEKLEQLMKSWTDTLKW